MIVWFDSNMVMHVDKKHDASNSFALAKYIPDGYGDDGKVAFKANAVVNGHTVLFTHTQITWYTARMIGWVDSSSATIRKHFFDQYLPQIEKAIHDDLRKDKKYKGDIKLRFRVGASTKKLFPGYTVVNRENAHDKYGDCYATYLILEKSI